MRTGRDGVSISQHPASTPPECSRCRQVFAHLTRAAADGNRATAAEIGQGIGLGERSVRLHLAHLVKHGHVQTDGRTPVPGMELGTTQQLTPAATAREWAAAQPVSDRACGALLRALARTGTGWHGTVTKAGWAREAGIAQATVTRHRPHLARMVEFEHSYDHDARGRLIQRPDAFRLVAVIRLVPSLRPVRPGGDSFDRKAEELLPQVEYLSSEEAQEPYLLSLVARALREGMPAPALLHRLTANRPRRITNGAGFLASRVPASGAEVTISARLALELAARPRPAAQAEPVLTVARSTARQRWCRGTNGRKCGAPADSFGLCPACRDELALGA